MRKDGELALIYSVIVVGMMLLYAGYEDLGLIKHAGANPAATQAEADDE